MDHTWFRYTLGCASGGYALRIAQGLVVAEYEYSAIHIYILDLLSRPIENNTELILLYVLPPPLLRTYTDDTGLCSSTT